MNKFIKKNISYISFILIPLLYFWNPHWLSFLGTQPYWPLFWLLPWSIVHGALSGSVVGLFLGLTLDSISPDSIYSQIPGLILCGLWFGRLSVSRNLYIEHFRYGFICSLGSFLCGFIYFSQILINNVADNDFLMFLPGIEHIFSQLFITGLLAPFFCSRLFILFKKSKDKKVLINLPSK